MNVLYELAMTYHYETEHYDRLVCTGGLSKYGGAMPRTEEEHRKMSSNAREVRHRILREAERQGIPQPEMQKAIGAYANLFNYEREHARRAARKEPEVRPSASL